MIKQLAWNTFKNTGNIDTFLELKQVIDIEENIKAENNEIIKNQQKQDELKEIIIPQTVTAIEEYAFADL